MTIKLIDLYSGNDEIHFSFDKIALEGYSGVIFKAGQGEWPDVPRVKPTWWADAKKAGLQRGWYWLKDARHKSSLEFEALKKWTNLDFGELGMWVDCEKPITTMKDRIYWTLPYSGYDDIYDLMVRIQDTKASFFNQNLPGIYTAPGFWKMLNVPAASARWFAQAPLWTAQYNRFISKPTMYGAWTEAKIWQVSEGPDVNVWQGTDAEYKAFFKPLSDNPLPIVSAADAAFEVEPDKVQLSYFSYLRGWEAAHK